MQIGPFALPVAPLILIVSIAVAVMVGRAIGKDRASIERVILAIVLVSLVVARLVFVMHYLPAYGADWLTILDIRDQGFDLLAGATAGGCVLAWYLLRRRAMRKALLAAAAASVVVWSAATLMADGSGPPPSVPVVALVNTAGQLQPLAMANGKPTVVNLWATWCPPCRAEMPVLAKAQADNPHVNIVFVNQGEPRDIVQRYLDETEVRIGNLLFDPKLEVAKATGVKGYPTTLFYDALGRLLSTHLGGYSRATFEHALKQFR
ncbi:prolipoprotein diacylglyceryl transferase family protein [Cupriavidus sp. CuC1]|uniref:prolipoprotein diacylglyceryl transferase family protein n=1 Tax=Cupriavidus sp. CuC1 TaxID=3373131 RepID=UPI0037CF563A